MKAFIATALFLTAFTAQPKTEPHRVLLPNGWALTPVGDSLPLGDLPLNIAVSPDKKLLAVTNNGQSIQSIQLIDVASQKTMDNLIVSKLWYGLKFSDDSKFLYANGGNDNLVYKYAVQSNHLDLTDTLRIAIATDSISVAGIDVDDAAHTLYAVSKQNNFLYIFDIANKKVTQEIPLPDAAYACMLSHDKKELFISCWGCDKILVYDVSQKKITSTIPVGDNPNELLLTKNGKYLFVSNANDNSVSMINVAQKKVIETLNAALYPNAPSGSTSNGLALSEDEKTLYIANADNNCLAVFDVSTPRESKSKGFIPTGWYPTNVKVIGKKIYVTNGKGFSSKANPNGPNPASKKQNVAYQKGDTNELLKIQYIGGLFKGTMSFIPIPSEKELSAYSALVYANTPYNKEKETQAAIPANNPVPSKVGNPSPIKHVFYILKENRTYDQVLGDIKEGNGDTSLVLFGNKVTPNQHTIAKQFVLLDNFYVDSEVSADGHNWSMGAYATDYLEKTWPTEYGDRGGNYDSEGNREIANNKNGFIWDQCKRSNVTYRTYGEFIDDHKPNLPVLKNHFCPYYTGWDMSVRDTTRFYQWKHEFDSLLKINAVPQLSTMRFPNDHTEGLRHNKPTPFAHAADNDLAVGLFIDYLSHSSIWNESVVFIVEDDAQNGPDHVDAHRSTAYIAGGLVKSNFVDHTMYSTSSVLHTIELILGMPPMTQYDAAATPLWNCFSNWEIHSSFLAIKPNIDLDDKNLSYNEWQKRSEKFNFNREDMVPDMELNEVLWNGLKGTSAPMPVRAAFIKANVKKDKD